MLLKERKYRTCKSCDARHYVRGEVYGCDTCGKEIDMNKPERDYLCATVHHHGGEPATDIHGCSWKCMAKALRKVKSDYFVSLPFLHFDDTPKGLRAQDFFALLK